MTNLDKLSAVDVTTNRYSINFEPIQTLVSQHNKAGRGMELSELTIYKNRLLSFDDRTGTVFEILSTPDGKDSYAGAVDFWSVKYSIL